MKKVLFLTTLLISFVANAKSVCYYPESCEEILSSEFSTGGGDSPSWVMELDCKTNDGITKYIHWELSAGGLFGFGRVSTPNKIDFKKHGKDELKCDY